MLIGCSPWAIWPLVVAQEFVEWAVEKYSSVMSRDDGHPANSSSVAAAAAGVGVRVVGGVGTGGEEDDMDGHEDEDEEDDDGRGHL